MQIQNFKNNKYYLSSVEDNTFTMPRSIYPIEELEVKDRKILKCRIEEAIYGYEYNLEEMNITEIYLIGRFDNVSFTKIVKYPYYAHLLVKKKPSAKINELNDLYNLAWVMVYDNLDDAKSHKIS